MVVGCCITWLFITWFYMVIKATTNTVQRHLGRIFPRSVNSNNKVEWAHLLCYIGGPGYDFAGA